MKYIQEIHNPSNGRKYEVEIGFDDLTSLRKSLSIDLVARRLCRDGEAEAEADYEIGATLTLDIERAEIVIDIEGREVARLRIGNGGAAGTEPMAETDMTGEWSDFLTSLAKANDLDLAETVGDAIAMIPTFDPFLGCVLKGAISASVEQTVRCYQATQVGFDGWRDRVRRIAGCLGGNVSAIVRKAARRAFRCFLLMGVG